MNPFFERRNFLKKLGRFFAGGIFILLLYFFNDLLKRFLKTDRKINFPLQKLTDKIYTGQEFFVEKYDRSLLVLSRKCPHLGCTLQKDPQENKIVCPCHGSTFTMQGRFLHGPAKKDMKRLTYRTGKDQQITIQL